MKSSSDCPKRQEPSDFQELLNYSFRNIKLLAQALTHKSFVHEKLREKTELSEDVCFPVKSRSAEHNQRLEFLGDALLGMVISEYLYRRFPQHLEGKLSKMKSLLVNRTLLLRKAREVRLGEYLFLGKGEESAGGRSRASLLADGFEALIGAIYLDRGLSACRRFILERLEPELEGLEGEGAGEQDYKSNLQEYTQSNFGQIPRYQVIATQGPSHQKTFEISVSWKGKVYGKGQGGTKKAAEQQAAREALEKLRTSCTVQDV